MGMSYSEYWDSEPNAVKSYREAHKIKQEESNTMAWLQGMYNYIGVATALNNGFSNSKTDYPNKPFELNKKEETPEEIRERYYQRFKQMEEMWNKANERSNTENQDGT